MKNIILVIFLALSFWNASAAQILNGQLSLWKRPPCVENKNCPLPQPLGITWPARFEIIKPTQPNTTTSTVQVYKQGPWSLHVSMFWKQPLNERDYLVTQMRLTHLNQGLVAECSRYDFIENIGGFVTGSCSGRIGNDQFGVTTHRKP